MLKALTNKNVFLILTFIGFFVFGNMLFNNFVWDDKTFIVLNPEVHTLNIPLLFGINLFNDTLYYRPIPALYSAFLYTIAGMNVFPYHLFQLAIHIACTFLLFLIFSKFFKKNISFLLSLVFLVHPMNVESVSFIAQTVSPLFFLFGISALYLTFRKKLKYSILLTGLFLLLSLLTKETGILFVVLVFLYSFLNQTNEKFKVIGAGIAAVLGYFFIRFAIGHVFYTKSLLISSIARAPLSERLFTIPSVAFYYLRTFVFPVSLAINQHWVTNSLNDFFLAIIIGAVVLIVIISLGFYFFIKSKKVFKSYIFFSAWFVMGLLFHLQIIPLDMTVADRWFYFPMAGLLGVMGVVLDYKFSKGNSIKIVTTILFVVIILSGIRTMIRNTNWLDAKTLYMHDMKISNNFELENNLGWEYIQDHNYKSAILHLNKSVGMWAGWDRSWYNLGVAYHFSNHIPEAKDAYGKALALNKNNAQVIENLSYLELFYYDPKQAKVLLEKGINKYPDRPKLWYFLALAEYKLGNKTQAKTDIEKAYLLDYSDSTIGQVYYLLQNNKKIDFR